LTANIGNKTDFDPLEHAVYLGRRLLGRYVRISRSLYAAYNAAGQPLGRFRNRKKAWTAISKAAVARPPDKSKRRAASHVNNAVPKRSRIVRASVTCSEGGAR
jgi:hypothetical protein